MRLRPRIILVSTFIVAASTCVSGLAAINANRSNQIANIDLGLNESAVQIANADDPLGASLLQIDALGATTEVAFYSINKDLSVLGDNSNVIGETPSLKNLRAAVNHSMSVAGSVSKAYRMRSVALPDNEFVILAHSLSEVDAETNKNYWLLLLYVVFAIALGGLALTFFTRRDLLHLQNLIDSAQSMSQGDLKANLPKLKGNSEVVRLNNSLSSMFDSLDRVRVRELEVQSKMQEFLQDASHELRTPLTLIRGYTELIFDNNALDQAHIARIRVRVSDQIERMQNLISDLLLLAEIGEHGATDFSTVNLTHVVQQAFEDLQTIQPRRPISVSLCEDAMVHADGRLVDQLLANLISNLSRYVPVKAPVSVKLEKNESQVTLVVEDGGPGLPNQATNEELQSFSRFDPSRSRTSGGSGLGLSIMNAIVQQHGGKMTLSRSHLGGLKTLIELPVRA